MKRFRRTPRGRPRDGLGRALMSEVLAASDVYRLDGYAYAAAARGEA